MSAELISVNGKLVKSEVGCPIDIVTSYMLFSNPDCIIVRKVGWGGEMGGRERGREGEREGGGERDWGYLSVS